MRNTHLVVSWGVLITLLCALAMPSWAAQDAKPDGISLTLSKAPFSDTIRLLAQENGMKLIMLTDVNTEVELNFPDPTPLEDIIARVSHSLGLDFWQESDTFYIGKRQDVTATPAVESTRPVLDPPPTTSVRAGTMTTPSVAALGTLPKTNTSTGIASLPVKEESVMRQIVLNHTSAHEIAWMLGVPGASIQDDRQKKVMRNRVESFRTSRNQRVKHTTGDDYSSPAMNSPWLNSVIGNVNRRSSDTDSNQIGGGFFGGQAGAAQPAAAAAPAGGNNQATATTTTDGSGTLKSFVPEGIEDIVGLIGLNVLLVKAKGETKEKAEAAIDQLEQLVKILDQPVKQVIVEVMFVEMTVEDAMSIGASWEFAGMPWSIGSANGGGEGNFKVRYIKGNLKAALATAITNRRAKVVNAPRVIVQNGSEASFEVEESIPFIITNEEEDVFGRKISTPEIEFQPFTRGLTARATIHPDDTVTLEVDPQLESPANSVPIPGGSGSVSGGTYTSVDAVVRVKNGETIMMGGFVSKNEGVGSIRAPLLSDLPIIGPLLFRGVNKSTNNKETMVFVTPTIMKDDTTDFGGMATLPPLF